MACCDSCEKGTGTCSGNKRGNGPNTGCGDKGKPFAVRADLPNDAMANLAGSCCEACAKKGTSCCGKKQWADAPFGLAPDLAPDVRQSLAGVEEVVEGLGDATTSSSSIPWQFLGGVVFGAVGMIVLDVIGKGRGGGGGRLFNPAHENFVGRRVEGGGRVVSVQGGMLVVKTHTGRLVRVRKDRVTLI